MRQYAYWINNLLPTKIRSVSRESKTSTQEFSDHVGLVLYISLLISSPASGQDLFHMAKYLDVYQDSCSILSCLRCLDHNYLGPVVKGILGNRMTN